MNSEYTKAALEKVGNPNILINLVSRRVRQLNGGSGASAARPLIEETAGLGAADIALLEIAEEKMSWEIVSDEPEVEVAPKKRRRSSASS